jgi:hypothetical protein
LREYKYNARETTTLTPAIRSGTSRLFQFERVPIALIAT